MKENQQTKLLIQGLVDLETKAWNEKDADKLLSLFHLDMVWAWPPDSNAHDPALWCFGMGRFDRERWRKVWQDLFDGHDLIRNVRNAVKIEVSDEGDGAFAVVDVDTLWRNRTTGKDFHWKGRACKTYTKMSSGEWKLIGHTGLLSY